MSQMDTSASGSTLRRRPSIHRSWNDINLTDDQKHTKMSESVETQKLKPNSPLVLHPLRVPNIDNEDSVNDSDQESTDKQDDNSSVETDLEDTEENLEISNTKSFDRSNISTNRDLHTSHNQEKVRNNNDVIISGAIIVLLISVFVACFTYDTKETFDLQSIKQSFPTQDDDLWIAFEAGVEDVVMRERPSTFILLYEKDAKDVIDELVYKLSKFAACNITDCEKEPIEVTDAELNSATVVRDYGTVIEKYRGKLEEKGVMVIKNLENVRGISAQAFHSFCDEFTPLVHKSLFIFTMQVDELPRSDDKMMFIEDYFRSRWTDIKIDAFNALITRITSMVLEVRM